MPVIEESTPVLVPVNVIEAALKSSSEKERWGAAEAAMEYVYLDLRQAIASCVLEHVLKHHFETFFQRLEAEIRCGNGNLRNTLKPVRRHGSLRVAGR